LAGTLKVTIAVTPAKSGVRDDESEYFPPFRERGVPGWMMGYRILDHTADIGIEVQGETREDLFSQAAIALIGLLTDRARLGGTTEKIIRVEGSDTAGLWINYLREILYLYDGESFIVKDVQRIVWEENSVTGLHLTAHCFGEIYDPRRHIIKTEIKAVTYHYAEVARTPTGWKGVFIVDV
jgi:SHS2 domain-containing protein